ncbi:GNAT family N-acetyltransferase [Bradyrhizobium australiense]|uniref:GNAT family N-acetyltransferase n=1 Tax=Bradyrhizobium australiense TaxID=2721161 RepID=A0A7Y4GT50_9BRAD|nr:GNAT family N-acetyltransferase [Bradyrhizobium australiense]NOJ41500.1 GNAT family N-acetyltransferase [Bradyrhizobium australiense]
MVTMREVSVDDATTVTQMVAALLAELGAGQAQAGLDTQLVANLLAMKQRVYGFLAFTEERPVGIIMVSESAALFARGTYGIITELYVVPDQRSSGVAMHLIEAAVGLGTEKGWGQLEVGAPRQPMWSRSPNSALYLKAGFAEIGPRLRLPLHGLAIASQRAQGNPAGDPRLDPRRQRARYRRVSDSSAAGLHERRFAGARLTRDEVCDASS